MTSSETPAHPRASWAMAASATLHCLTGCAIGEILGMVVGTAIGLHDAGTVVLSVALAFAFGYALTMRGVLRAGVGFAAALKLALAADTASILVMEVVDNAVMVLVPGAMSAGATSPLFWASLAFALAVAFLVALSLRPWPSGGDPAQVVAFGVLQFLLAVGTGTYVRGWQVKVAPTPLLGLLRRQWPMMAGLSVLLFAEFANRGTGFGDLALLLGSLVLAALAVIGPLRPVEAALLGACALVCTGVGNRLIGVGSDELGPLSLTAVAAVMLLISYAVRHAAVRRAG